MKFKTEGTEAGVIGEGLCAVKSLEGLWGYVDMTGKQVIASTISSDYAGMFFNGIARLDTGFILLQVLGRSDAKKIEESKDLKISYIDKTGKYIWKQPEHLEIDGNTVHIYIVIVTIAFLLFICARRYIKRRYAKSLKTLETDVNASAPQGIEDEQEFKE